MFKITINARIRKILYIFVFQFSFGLIFTISLHGLQARQQNMSIATSLLEAWHKCITQLPGMIFGFAISASIIYLILGQSIPTAKTSLEAGLIRWRRMRIFGMISLMPVFIFSLGMMIYHMTLGRWLDFDWLLLLVLFVSVILLIRTWTYTPESEHLYAMETGDTTRMNDERMQQIQYKAAQTTLPVFMGILILVGIPYEAIVIGRWPVLTLIDFGVLFIIWTAATTYWNKKL